ncbi:2-hydroxyacid dehydrogenase [Paracoccus zeaxanthinifaciens]|uniref:2-hydroxyacid dehydrogenase n=1 Tax=Paracoccus zeaxanthinifaciens TaxID=187400 RepID=UPI0003B33804|nr:glyoxylate/hydroxypyruvate reductase A [Paracoccus zeaxanthinifaciens]
MDRIEGVYLSDSLDLQALYGDYLGEDVVLRRPEDVADPAAVRLAVCWQPGQGAFAAYPNLEVAMSIGAGVDALLDHSGLPGHVGIARVRDPHQAALMAGFVAHEVLHDSRNFPQMAANAARRVWHPHPMQAPEALRIAVLGHGTMGRAVIEALRVLGFTLRVACRSTPDAPLPGVTYLTGDDAVGRAADGADVLVNVLPLTDATRDILDAALLSRLAPGARLIQIGRGEHLVEADLTAALDAGHLSGATLDVFRTEPLPADHPFWADERLRITPHIASDSIPEVVADQIMRTARALRDGQTPDLLIDRSQGY